MALDITVLRAAQGAAMVMNARRDPPSSSAIADIRNKCTGQVPIPQVRSAALEYVPTPCARFADLLPPSSAQMAVAAC